MAFEVIVMRVSCGFIVCSLVQVSYSQFLIIDTFNLFSVNEFSVHYQYDWQQRTKKWPIKNSRGLRKTKSLKVLEMSVNAGPTTENFGNEIDTRADGHGC